jgi:hypothetical protein
MTEQTELEFVKASDVKIERPPHSDDVPESYPWPAGIGEVLSNGTETVVTTQDYGSGQRLYRRGIVDSVGNTLGFSSHEERRYWLYTNGYKPIKAEMTGFKTRRTK